MSIKESGRKLIKNCYYTMNHTRKLKRTKRKRRKMEKRVRQRMFSKSIANIYHKCKSISNLIILSNRIKIQNFIRKRRPTFSKLTHLIKEVTSLTINEPVSQPP